VLDAWLGDLPVGLHAEHGLWSRPPGQKWRQAVELPQGWKGPALKMLRKFADRLPGALVEEKTLGVAWHYRLADPEAGALAARELRMQLATVFSKEGLEVLPGDKVVELRPSGVHKGLVVEELKGELSPDAFVLAIGDDRTDEDLYAALPPGGVALRVGSRPTPRASLRVRDPAALQKLLERFAAD
jgi:trehalose 6-phosphate synthase/phosphatase